MDAKTQILVSRLTNFLVGNPSLGIELWQNATVIDQEVRSAVLNAAQVYSPINKPENIIKAINQLESSREKKIQITGKILRWSAKNYNTLY